MARRRVNTTKYEIIQEATQLFLTKGYSNTTPKQICDTLDISTGNLTYYFPTKEHLLAVLVDMLCRFQAKTIQDMVEEDGVTSLLAVCTELTSMAAMSEDSQIAKDLFLSAYSSPICLEIIRRNDAKRSRIIYKEFCSDWTEQQFVEAETLVSGIEYATLMTTGDSSPLEVRIAGALNSILMIYDVPEQLRKQKISKALTIDYRTHGRYVLEKFIEFVEQTNEHTFEALLNGTYQEM